MELKLKLPQFGRYGPVPDIDPGAPPAMLTDQPDAAPPTVTVLAYGPDGLMEETVTDLDRIKERLGQWSVVWVHVDGMGHADRIREIGEAFGLHPLALEDVANRGHRPKLEESTDYIFIMLQTAFRREHLSMEQLGLFFDEKFVLTFQEGSSEYLQQLRDRIRTNRGRLRRMPSDYLAYAILDAVVDNYFPVLERFADDLEALEDEVVLSPNPSVVSRIHSLKRELLTMRRMLWPMREVVNSLMDEQVGMLSRETRPFIRDCYDHVIQAIDLVAAYREVAAALSDIYLSSVSNRMNEIMKVLTIVSTIFIPLTFMSGLYGMNFNTEISPWNMPELNWAFGYPVLLLVMLGVVVGMLLYFKSKKWL
jgi:magnesium transporter